MASVDEFFGDFDPGSYAETMNRLQEPELQNEYAFVKFKSLTAKTGVGAGLVGLVATCGGSLVGSGINARRAYIMGQKLSIIELLMACKGWVPRKMRKRDQLLAFGPTVVVSRPSFSLPS